MEVALKVCGLGHLSFPIRVSILVLMEVALKGQTEDIMESSEIVSILVLMEVALKVYIILHHSH